MSFSRRKGWKTKPPPGCTLDRTHPLARNLVSWWMFNSTSQTLRDMGAISNGLTQTNLSNGLPNSQWIGSPTGQGLNLNPIESKYSVKVPRNGNIYSFGNGSGVDRPFSLVVRAKWNSFAAYGALLAKWQYSSDYAEWLFYYDGTKWAFQLFTNGIGDNYTGRTAPKVDARDLNIWRTFVATYSGDKANSNTGTPFNIYIDRDKVDDTQIGFPISTSYRDNANGMLPGQAPVQIGCYDGSNARGHADMVIDDARIYSRVLTPADLELLQNDPYGAILAPQVRRFFVPAGNSPQTALPTEAISTWVGNDPTIAAAVTVTPTEAISTWVGNDPTIVAAVTVTPAEAVSTWVGNDPTIVAAVTASPDGAVSTWTGNDPTIAAAVTVTPTEAVSTWVGNDPAAFTDGAPQTASPAEAISTWIGNDPAIAAAVIALPSVAISTWSANDPTTLAGGVIVLPAEAISTWIGNDPSAFTGSSQPQIANPDAATSLWIAYTPEVLHGAKIYGAVSEIARTRTKYRRAQEPSSRSAGTVTINPSEGGLR